MKLHVLFLRLCSTVILPFIVRRLLRPHSGITQLLEVFVWLAELVNLSTDSHT